MTAYSSKFKDLLENTDLNDSGKGFGLLPTWNADHPFFFRITIDHCFFSNELILLDRNRGKKIGSDHYPIFVDFTWRS